MLHNAISVLDFFSRVFITANYQSKKIFLKLSNFNFLSSFIEGMQGRDRGRCHLGQKKLMPFGKDVSGQFS